MMNESPVLLYYTAQQRVPLLFNGPARHFPPPQKKKNSSPMGELDHRQIHSWLDPRVNGPVDQHTDLKHRHTDQAMSRTGRIYMLCVRYRLITTAVFGSL